MKIIIAGSRNFEDGRLLYEKCDEILREIPKKEIHILLGDASGADYIGHRYAIDRQFSYTTFLADWNKFGIAAGPIRNKEMIKEADMLIAFWDGVSRGTRDVIRKAKKQRIKTFVFDYND